MTSSSQASSRTHVFLPRERFVGELHANVVSDERCAALIDELSARGFAATGEHYPADYRNNDRIVFEDPAFAAELFAELRDRLPPEIVEDGARWELTGLNARFRACRYANGQAFCIHRDGAHAPSDDVRSFFTVQLYLDDDPARVGGHTRFYADPQGREPWAAISPARGGVILFDHRVWHDGEPVHAGIKHVLRTDAMYRRVEAIARADEPDVIGRHRGYAWSAIACRDGSVVSSGRDGTVRRWLPAGLGVTASSGVMGGASSGATRVGTVAVRATSSLLDLHLGSVTKVVEARDGSIWCGTRAGVIVRLGPSPQSDALVGSAAEIAVDQGAIVAAAAVDDLVAFATSRGTIVAFRHEGVMAWSIVAHDGWGCALATDGEHLLSCGHDGRVLRVNRDGRARIVATFDVPIRAVHAMPGNPARSRDHTYSYLAVGDDRGWVHSLGRTGSILTSVRAHAGPITALAATRDGALLSAGEDGAVLRWTGMHASVLLRLRDHVTSLVVDGDHAIISGYDGAIRRIATS